MRSALGILLDGACYHMTSVTSGDQTDWSLWEKATQRKSKIENREWVQFFEGRGFRAGVDYPVSLFYK